MRARQVVRDERGQEVMLSFGTSPAKFASKENAGGASAASTRLPDYLDAEEPHDPEADKKAIARVGGSNDSSGGWLSSIGGENETSFTFLAIHAKRPVTLNAAVVMPFPRNL
jgi:armadillo repeat-containing protein 1